MNRYNGEVANAKFRQHMLHSITPASNVEDGAGICALERAIIPRLARPCTGHPFQLSRTPFKEISQMLPHFGPVELILILVIVTMLFGVGKLPEVLGQSAKACASPPKFRQRRRERPTPLKPPPSRSQRMLRERSPTTHRPVSQGAYAHD